MLQIGRKLGQGSQKVAGPGGLWWRVTVKEAPRYMWSSYPKRPHPRGIDIDFKSEHEAQRPEFTEYFDDLPDKINPQKVQPFLEYRNAAVGVYHGVGEDVKSLYWKPVLAHRNYNILKLKEEDDNHWRKYVERNSIDPRQYMTSQVYETRYNGTCDNYEAYVWNAKRNFYRNFKTQRPAWRTRPSCWYHDCAEVSQLQIMKRQQHKDPESFKYKQYGTYSHNHPCPLCRDWKLLVNYKNVELLKQFIDKSTGYMYPSTATSICEFQQARVAQAIDAARQLGTLEYPTVDLGFSEWDVDDYQPTSQTTAE